MKLSDTLLLADCPKQYSGEAIYKFPQVGHFGAMVECIIEG